MELFVPTVSAALLATAMSTGAAENLVRQVMMLEVWSIAAMTEYGENGPFTPEALATYFTDGFSDQYEIVMGYQDALDIPLIDGDPITGSQEYCPLADVQIGEGIVDTEIATAAVTVTFQSYWCYPEAGPDLAGAVTEVGFDLVFIDKKWRIDDFVVNGNSFRALLSQFETDGQAEAAYRANLPPAKT